MIQPEPFKLVCPNCDYEKIVKPKSDVLNPADFNNICPKCKSEMERKELNTFDNILNIFK